jgi:hypothetical protein
MFRTAPLLVLLSLPAWPAEGPLREASAPAIVGNSMPGFYNGYLYSAEPRHVLTLFAPDGHELFSLPLAGRGNGKVAIESVAIDSDGTLALAWQDSPNAGIDIRNLSGSLVRSIDTGLYVPAHLSFGTDHSLWALGWQRDAAKPTSADQRDYQILKRYSIDGNQTGAYLPKSLFAAGLPPGMSAWQHRAITVTADRVGVEVFSGTNGNQREWVELDLTGNVKGRWRLEEGAEALRVAFTSDDQAYVRRTNYEAQTTQVVRLNRTTSTWDVVKTADSLLYGADGDKLVFLTSHDGISHDGPVLHLSWFPQP